MTAAIGHTILGAPVDRVDGPLKVAGAAPYPSDVTLPGLVHAALVRATITVGTITRIDTDRAEALDDISAFVQMFRTRHRRTADAEHTWLGLNNTLARTTS